MSLFRRKLQGQNIVSKRALIVSVAEYYPHVDLTKRKGVNRDTQRLHKVLSRLGFHVKIKNDLAADEIYQAFKAESEKTVSDCFVGILSSHGEEGVVFGADGQAVELARIYRCFGAPPMTGKTKLFLIQACRGPELDDGVQVQTDSSVKEEEGLSHLSAIPIDTAVMFATVPGYSAFTHPSGSVFLQTFCDLLEKEGGSDFEINQLMTRLNNNVAHRFEARGRLLGGKKEMPCFVSRLTKEAFPFMHPKKTLTDSSLNVSTTDLVDEPYRPRQSSIS